MGFDTAGVTAKAGYSLILWSVAAVIYLCLIIALNVMWGCPCGPCKNNPAGIPSEPRRPPTAQEHAAMQRYVNYRVGREKTDVGPVPFKLSEQQLKHWSPIDMEGTSVKSIAMVRPNV